MTSRPYTHPRIEPGATGHLDLVEALRAMPGQLRELTGDMAEHFLRERPPGEWSIKEIVGHIRDWAEIDHRRLTMMATQWDPVLQGYDQDEVARQSNHQESDAQELLDNCARWRAQTVDLLTGLVNWNWARTGQHTERGRMSIRQFVERMIAHEQGHLEEIQRRRGS